MYTKSRILMYLLFFLNGSCLKSKNQWPPNYLDHDRNIAVNCWLGKINALSPIEGVPIKIDSDWTIAVQVRADDATGNFYNQLIVEDSTAGIALQINAASLYNQFPIGRKLYLRLQGLYLANYHGSFQIGSTPFKDQYGQMQVSGIPEKFLSQFIIPATILSERQPLSISLKTLKVPRPELVNRLLRIDDVELLHPNQDLIYADPLSSSSILLHDCMDAQIILRTSNYARFQSVSTPYGKGSICGIYTLYNGVGQIAIRDTSDVQCGLIRCDGSLQTVPILLSIDSLRKFYLSKDTVLGNYQICGVVTSDITNNNFGTGNIIVQNEQKGIILYFGATGSDLPLLGDSVTINIAGSTLTQYAGALEIKNIKVDKIKVWSSGNDVLPVALTIATLNTHFKQFESVLIKISDAKIIGSAGVYSGNKTLSDGTGNIILYTSSAASFANQLAPSITKTFQGIAMPYNATNEIKIRNPSIDIY